MEREGLAAPTEQNQVAVPCATNSDNASSQQDLIAELASCLKWALQVGRLDYHQRIAGQNEAYCDAVDHARAVLRKATGEAK